MSLFHHYFDRSYALEFEAWGDGEISEKNLEISLDDIFAEYAKEKGGYPIDISLDIADTLSFGYSYGFTSIDTAFLEKLDSKAGKAAQTKGRPYPRNVRFFRRKVRRRK